MNNSRTHFDFPEDHIKISSYWLLGFIEGEESFFLLRTKLNPHFTLSLTAVLLPVLEKIKNFLYTQLGEYSQFKAINTKLINIQYEPAHDNIKAKYKLLISQIDYLYNIFIPFFKSLKFLSKKGLDF